MVAEFEDGSTGPTVNIQDGEIVCRESDGSVTIMEEVIDRGSFGIAEHAIECFFRKLGWSLDYSSMPGGAIRRRVAAGLICGVLINGGDVSDGVVNSLRNIGGLAQAESHRHE